MISVVKTTVAGDMQVVCIKCRHENKTSQQWIDSDGNVHFQPGLIENVNALQHFINVHNQKVS